MDTANDRQRDLEWVQRLGHWGLRIIAVVLLLALVFTMVNVQQFAAKGTPQFGVQWWIAWLLDPMASLTMATAIVFEGFLADYDKPKVGWLVAAKWYAAVAVWGMNIWQSAASGSFAGVWLHSVAPGLVCLLAEAAPRVRRHMADVITDLSGPDRVGALADPPIQQPQPLQTPAPLPSLPNPLQRPTAHFPPPPVVEPTRVVTHRPAAPIPTAVKPPTPARRVAPNVDDLLGKARQLKATRAAAGQRCGWRVLVDELGVSQSSAKELARRINNPTRLEAKSA